MSQLKEVFFTTSESRSRLVFPPFPFRKALETTTQHQHNIHEQLNSGSADSVTLLPVSGQCFPRTYQVRYKGSTTAILEAFSSIGDACGIDDEEPVFRPPAAEWRSLILQVTIGCSWNACTFFEMYLSKEFQAKQMDAIVDELDQVVAAGGAPHVRGVFLADGDAMTFPTGKLEAILGAINERLPRVRRILSYCLPRKVQGKSAEALPRQRSKGLSLVYVGCESGDDVVLSAVEKGETAERSLEALEKLKEAGIKRSIMILLGRSTAQVTQYIQQIFVVKRNQNIYQFSLRRFQEGRVGWNMGTTKVSNLRLHLRK